MSYGLDAAARDLRACEKNVAHYHEYIANLDLAGLHEAAAEAWKSLPSVHEALDTQTRIFRAMLSCRP